MQNNCARLLIKQWCNPISISDSLQNWKTIPDRRFSLKLTMLWANSADDKLMIFFLIFPRKYYLDTLLSCSQWYIFLQLFYQIREYLSIHTFGYNSYLIFTAFCKNILLTIFLQPLPCWAQIYPAFANSVDPDQLASEEANWSGSALFAIKFVNL